MFMPPAALPGAFFSFVSKEKNQKKTGFYPGTTMGQSWSFLWLGAMFLFAHPALFGRVWEGLFLEKPPPYFSFQ